ncbi:uncharacterized protein [Dermacentor andersoni]|uniref:uncharacterized protein isoform X1 n=1 Tax=Dermacentor andersoni TaxID=34620 RepID=UPI0024176D2A|nr:uncharacterized protein LOC126545601 isoform X1 [Dermacentor andersoni]
MASHAVLAALLIASGTTFGGGSPESYEHSGSATRTSEPHITGARVKEHLPNRERRAAHDVDPSGNIGDRNKPLNCETEGYSCLPRHVCKNYMFIPFLFGCTNGKVCCEKTEREQPMYIYTLKLTVVCCGPPSVALRSSKRQDESTRGTSCLTEAAYQGVCVPKKSWDNCVSREPTSDCPLSQVCCRN